MRLLQRESLLESLDSLDDNSIFLQPLLERAQVNAVSVDLRLGPDFAVSVLTRRPSIALAGDESKRGIASYFQETRRDIGNTFVVYPNQLVLAVSLEYVSLPNHILMDVVTRSSFSRLGIVVSGVIQPGYRGCVPLELYNHGSSPVELIVGGRVCQGQFFELENCDEYLDSKSQSPRKYFGAVRPVLGCTVLTIRWTCA